MRVATLTLFALLLSTPIHAAPRHSKTQPQKQQKGYSPRATEEFTTVAAPLKPDQIVINVHQDKPDPNEEAPAQRWRRREWGVFWFGLITLVINGVLAGVGWYGIRTANRTLKQIKKQNKIAQKTLILQFRPKIVMRGAQVDFENSDVASLQMEFTNAGSSSAYITNGKLSLIAIHERGSSTVYEEDISRFIYDRGLQSKSLGPGAYTKLGIPLPVSVVTQIDKNLERLYPTSTAWTSIILSGKITYRDEIGTFRHTGFHRQFVPNSGQFIAVADTDLEYAD